MISRLFFLVFVFISFPAFAACPVGSSGEIQFYGSAGNCSSDASLFWDNTNKRLGIGTTTPQRTIHIATAVAGTPTLLAFENSNTTNGYGSFMTYRGTTTGSGGTSFQEAASVGSEITDHNHSTFSSTMEFWTAAGGVVANRLKISPLGNMGINTASPEASAQLEVFSVTKGFLPPRMTQAQRNAISSPVEGLTVFNKSSKLLETYNGTSWISGGSGSSIQTIGCIIRPNSSGIWSILDDADHTPIGCSSISQYSDRLEVFFTTPFTELMGQGFDIDEDDTLTVADITAGASGGLDRVIIYFRQIGASAGAKLNPNTIGNTSANVNIQVTGRN